MPDEDTIEIQISRIIPASKWRVIRQITKVKEFPKYIPTIKEVTVLQKGPHRIKTKWRIQLDKVPISWIEEDSLALIKNAICFRAVEGDLERFEGEWIFQEHPEGTKVTVNIYLKVGIPVIKEFADAYIKKIITENFQLILESVESRLISIRYASFKKGQKDKVAGFAVIGHFYNFNHAVKNLKIKDPRFKEYSKEFVAGVFNLSPSFKAHEIKEFRSKTGATTPGYFILCTIIPDMIDINVEAVYSKVKMACKVTEKYGAGIVTLGGFTSIVGERYGQKISKEVDIPITTGNTLTAALAVEGVLKAANLMEIGLKNAKLAIIGSTGDIGSACARALASKVKHITITGRTKSNLRKMWLQLKFIYGARHLKATTDNIKAVKDADIVIACAAVSSSILNINAFKPGAVICDLAYPKNISYTATTRNDILIFSGGLATTPTPVDAGVDMGLPTPNVIYGCFAEAIVLALERRYENYSEGRGNITPDKMDEIKHLALKHGFEIAPFYWGNRLIDEKEMFVKIK